MDELKNMTDYELAQRIQSFRSRLDALMKKVTAYMDDGTGSKDDILDTYKTIKAEVKADAHYVDLIDNRKGRAEHYRDFTGAVSEAAAFGFTAPTNSAINRKLFSAIEEAHYKLGKCHPSQYLKDEPEHQVFD